MILITMIQFTIQITTVIIIHVVLVVVVTVALAVGRAVALHNVYEKTPPNKTSYLEAFFYTILVLILKYP